VPFLSISGLTVPVLTGQNSRAFEDAGRASRGVSGQLSKDRRFLRRKFEFKTGPISLSDYITLRGFLHRQPSSFRFENNLNSNLQTGGLTVTASNTAYASSIASDGTAVLGQVAYGSYALLPAGNGTNLWASNLATGGDASQTTVGISALLSGAISLTTARAWRGTRSFAVTTAGVGSGLRTAAFAPIVNTSYAASLFITGTAQPVACELWANSTVLASVTVTPDPTAWQRVKLIAGVLTTSGMTDMHVRVTQSGATVGTYYIDGLQLEAQSFVTPWMDGVRSTITSTILQSTGARNLFGTKEGFSVSARVQRLTVPGGTICQVANNQGYNNEPYPGLVLGAVVLVGQTVTHSGTTPGVVVTTDAQTSVAVAPTLPLNWGSDDAAFHQIAAVVVPKPLAGKPSISLYFDGVLAGSSTADISGLSCEKMQRLCLGCHGTDYPFAAPLDDVAIFPFPLSDKAVLGLYQTGQVSQSWPVHTLSGDALPYGAVNALGDVQKAEFVTTKIKGVVQNAVQVGLTFMER
jgi:hypothetical protein